MKNRLQRKRRVLLALTGLTAASAGVAAASCAKPTEAAVNALFKPSSSFGDATRGLSTTDVVARGLAQDDGFKAFMDDAMGKLLLSYYDGSPLDAENSKPDTWKKSIDTTWDTTVQSAKNSYRNDYQLHLQTDTLDASGGSEAAWRQRQLDQRAVSDFAGMVFANNRLALTDASGNAITKPSRAALEDPANWPNLKFTAQQDGVRYGSGADTKSASDNDQQMFAEIQGYVVRQWVLQDNPNILARTVFQSETPKVGFNAIFNKDLNAVSAASYETMAFSPVDDADPTRNATGSYEAMVQGDGLNKYLNPTHSKNTYGVDIPGYLSGDGAGKLTVDSTDMFTAYDAPFSAAYVNQYLRDVLGQTYSTDLLGATQTLDQTSIMANFLRAPENGEKASAYSSLDWATNKASVPAFAKKTFNLFADTAATAADGYYANYAQLESGSAKIFDVAMPANADQFTLARGKDGVHVIAVDGAKYYLNGASRDVDKQMQYLLFRSLYKSEGYPLSDYDYTFDASSQAATFFSKNQSELLFGAFSAALGDAGSYLNQPQYAGLKAAFLKLQPIVDQYVAAYRDARLASGLRTAVDDMRSKLLARDDTYVSNDKAGKGYLNGIAGRLPDVQAADGSFPQLEYYYALMAYDEGLLTAAPSYAALAASGTRALFTQLVASTQSRLLQAAAKMADSLQLAADASVSAYSQVVTLSSATDGDMSLPVNLAMQATLASAGVTDAVKATYFEGDADFKAFYDFKTGGVTASSYAPNVSSLIQAVAAYDYGRKLLSAQSDHAYYGTLGASGDMAAYKTVLATAVQDQAFAAEPESAAAIDWYSYLYTFDWLLQGDLGNLKRILAAQVSAGSPAFVSWTVPEAARAYDGSQAAQAAGINSFDSNPDWWWGSPSNFMNAAGSVADADASDDLSDPYAATLSDDGTSYRYGFNGLSVQGDGKTNAALDSVLYTEFAKAFGETGAQQQADQTGALYWYGSNADDVIAYAKANLTTARAQDAFVDYLVSGVGVSVPSGMTSSNTDAASRLDAIVAWLTSQKTQSPYLFARFTGYVGQNKSATSVSASQPVLSSDGAQSLPTYAEQVNYADVNALDASWSTAASSRLNLSLGEFLAIVSQQALDPGTQSTAVGYIISHNGGGASVGDKRLYDALTSRWAKAA